METLSEKIFPHGYDPDPNSSVQHVVIDRIQIPFWNLVGSLIKLSFAMIPATVIILLVYAVCAGFLASFIATLRP